MKKQALQNESAVTDRTEIFDPSERNNGKQRRMGMPIKVLCYTAVFTALSAVCNIFTFFVGAGGAFALSLTYIPDFFAGALLGPLPGLVTGLCGDLIGCWIAPKGDLNPIILVASGLMGLIPGVVFKLFRASDSDKKRRYIAYAVSIVAVYAICTTLNTIGLYLFYFKGAGKSLYAVFALRTPKQTAVWGINAVLIGAMLQPLYKLVKI